MPTAPTLTPPSIGASAEARDMELEHMVESLCFLGAEVSIARCFVETGNAGGLSYAVRLVAERCRAIIDSEGRLARLRNGTASISLDEVLDQGAKAATLGKAALSAFWRALSEAQRFAIGKDQRDAWANVARVVDEQRDARDGAEA